MGVTIWKKLDYSCAEEITQVFQGPIQVFVNDSSVSSLVGGLAVLDQEGQIAGIKMGESFLMCSALAYRTHIRDIVLIVHPSNMTSLAFTEFDPSMTSELTKLESQVRFFYCYVHTVTKADGDSNLSCHLLQPPSADPCAYRDVGWVKQPIRPGRAVWRGA